MAYTSITGKLVNNKFLHTKRTAPVGYQGIGEDRIQQMGKAMIREYADPESRLSKMTAQLRAAGHPCMKDDLDRGADIFELCRQSVFIQSA